jgi:hypothetical protein
VTDLSSADKNEIHGVKKQRSNPNIGEGFAAVVRRLCVYRNEKFNMFIFTNSDFFMTMNFFGDESLNLSSYNEDTLSCSREIY